MSNHWHEKDFLNFRILIFGRDIVSLQPIYKITLSLILTLRNIGYQCKIGSSSLFGELTLAVLIFVANLFFMKYLGDVGVAFSALRAITHLSSS